MDLSKLDQAIERVSTQPMTPQTRDAIVADLRDLRADLASQYQTESASQVTDAAEARLLLDRRGS